MPQQNPPQPHATRLEYLLLLLLTLAYAVPVIFTWNKGYLDFGDGNYMYISWRISQGAVLYHDILAPQPPLHLFTGATLAWIGDRLLDHPIWAFRAFSLLLHLATMILVWRTSRLLFSHYKPHICRSAAVASAAIYLFLPIGFWWTLGYQSQPLLIYLLLTMFYGVLRSTRRWTIIAAIAAGCALITNMTTAPYVLFTIGWLILRRGGAGLLFAALALLIPALVIPAMEFTSGGYLSNVVNNQVGAFPRADVMAQSGQTVADYILGKLSGEGNDVLVLEGTWLALAIIGMIAYQARHDQRITAHEYALYFSFFSFCSLFYVAKGGTVDYVFSLAEPYIAIYAALPLLMASQKITALLRSPFRYNDLTPILIAILPAAFLWAACWPGFLHNRRTLLQETYELSEIETLRIVNQIQSRTRPNDLIIAPPHFAFLAKRNIVEDYSEHLLWRLKYMNERLDGIEGQAVATVKKMAEALNRKELPYLVLDLNQTGSIPEIEQAVKANYTPLLKQPMYTLNTPLQFYVPNP